jgi:hypothetical protein
MFTLAVAFLVILVVAYALTPSKSAPSNARPQSQDDSVLYIYMMTAMASDHSPSPSHHSDDAGQVHLHDPSMGHDTGGHGDIGGDGDFGGNVDVGGHDFG